MADQPNPSQQPINDADPVDPTANLLLSPLAERGSYGKWLQVGAERRQVLRLRLGQFGSRGEVVVLQDEGQNTVWD
jgi:hypothetical protein